MAGKIDKDEAVRLRAEDPTRWTYPALAKRYDVTKAAISLMFKALADKGKSVPVRSQNLPWPWRFKAEHASGNATYRAALALLKHETGLPLDRRELEAAKTLRRFADDTGMAISYDRETGFKWVSRREGDESEYFVKRP